MASLNFPPTDESPWTTPDGIVYVWDGDKWVCFGNDKEVGPEGPEGPEGPPGPQGDPFLYENFTQPQLDALKGPEGPEGPPGPQGDPFLYENFTQPQLDDLKGEVGEPGLDFTYDDFTQPQLDLLKGEPGEPGPLTFEDFTPAQLQTPGFKGAKGPQGPGGPGGPGGPPGQDGIPANPANFTANKHENGSGSGGVPGIYPTGDTDTGLCRNAADNYGIITGGTYRGKFQGENFTYRGIYNTTTGQAENVYVGSDGRCSRSTSSRAYKTDIRSINPLVAKLFLEKAQPVKYKAFIPEYNWPQEYIDDIENNPQDHEPLWPTVEDCDIWCKNSGYTEWTKEGKTMNEGVDPNQEFFGFIAEDLGENFPELATYSENLGRYDSVSYSRITAVLTAICQNQETRIKQLETRLDQLGETT